MSKTAAKREATYARELIRQLLEETDSAERADIVNELVASVQQIGYKLDEAEWN